MKIPEKIAPYLKGKLFSNGLIIDYKCKKKSVKERQQFLLDTVKGASVIHIGFSDHLPLIDEKIKNNTWLHQRLIKETTHCIGIDINEEAVKYCSKKHHIENIYHHDIVQGELLNQITDQHWDYAILGEIVEHVGNPVEFLQQLRKRYGAYINNLIITVPNAWDLTNLVYVRHGKEYINTDHRFWFTPYTISKIAYEAGYNVTEISMVSSQPTERWIYRKLRNKYPMLNDTIVITCQC